MRQTWEEQAPNQEAFLDLLRRLANEDGKAMPAGGAAVAREGPLRWPAGRPPGPYRVPRG
jgi:hypothetical protein